MHTYIHTYIRYDKVKINEIKSEILFAPNFQFALIQVIFMYSNFIFLCKFKIQSIKSEASKYCIDNSIRFIYFYLTPWDIDSKQNKKKYLALLSHIDIFNNNFSLTYDMLIRNSERSTTYLYHVSWHNSNQRLLSNRWENYVRNVWPANG